MIRRVLWVSGILTAIALIPGAVILGLFLGILPGIILAVSPTIFLYVMAFELLRIFLRTRVPIRGMALNTAAGAMAIAVGVAVATPFALQGRKALAAATKDDVGHAGPVQLEGNVRLDRFGFAWSRMTESKKVACDALCAALLDTPGVQSVTIGGSDASGQSVSPVTYRLIAKNQAKGGTLMPLEPAAIVAHLPDAEQSSSARGHATGRPRWKDAMEAKKALANSVTARWSLRLASAESLVAQPPLTAFERTITIRDVRPSGMHRIAVNEVEIADANGDVLLRRQRLTASPIAAPVHLTPGGPMLDSGWEVGRKFVFTGPRYFDFKPVELLFRETTMARPIVDEALVSRLREALAGSTTATMPGDRTVMIAPWLATLDWGRLDEKDIDVLAKLIADPGATGIERIYDGYATSVSPRLRHPIAVRLLEPSTDDRLRSTLNTLVRNMPDGTYATLLPEERRLLADRTLRLRSSALVARLADQGTAALPRLVQLLLEDVRIEPWYKRRGMLDDIRRAFSSLGRDAAGALPEVERLFEMNGTPLTNSSDDADAWRTVMVRMGKPVETLTFPSHANPELVARDRERIRTQAERGPER